jgi:predicted alpha-1,2-mannosidase
MARASMIAVMALCLRDAHGAGASADLVSFVNPFLGTEKGALDYGLNNGAGDTFPGPVFPFGMVQWSPDTTRQAGGYRYSQGTIHGFSVTHFSGRGVACWMDFPILPTIGPLGTSPGTAWHSYGSPFSHAGETAQAGSYEVTLDAHKIRVEITVTARTGLARFTFPPSAAATVMVNAGGSVPRAGEKGTGVTVVGTDQVTGSVVGGHCGGGFDYKLYFAARFSRPFTAFGTWSGGALKNGSRASAGAQSGAYLTFDAATAGQVVLMKVGLSFVSVEGAQANLAAESPNWDFDSMREGARAAWNSWLGRFLVEGGSVEERTLFYTSLYHSLIHPSIFSDANGQYIGFDQAIHSDSTRIQYHNIASWDDYRNQVALLALIAPEQASDIAQSLVNDATQDPGGGLPRWEHANANSGGMIGDNSDVILANLYAFGARRFDARSALAAMERGASRPSTTSSGHPVREGLHDYLSKGYVATDTVDAAAARTLEYCIDDFAISQLARALGETEKHKTYLARAQNWRNLFSAEAGGYIVPRDETGEPLSTFRPATQEGFCEGSAAQYVWMVPFNLRGLFDAMGGNAAATSRLDRHFTQLNAGPASEYAFMGNEPESVVPWEYAFAGAPWRTQDVARRVLQLFHNRPDGMPGNDDGGAMGSWFVFASVGLFPAIPGVGGFVIGSPRFPSVTVRLAGDRLLRIRAPGASDENRYVRGLKLNGAAHDSPWIDWAALSGGGMLDFALGSLPDKSWGAGTPPPSFQ